MEQSELEKRESRFRSGAIAKQQYIDEMHALHESLFDYSSFIKSRDIKEIAITDDSVIFTTRSNGIRLTGDRDDLRIIPVEILNFGSYEREELDFVMRLIDTGHNVLDIGANIGWYSINISRSVRDAKVYSFEPIPRTYKMLKRNLELNGCENVETFNFGFSDEAKELRFYYYKEGSGNASLARLTERESTEEIVCKVDTIDHYMGARNFHVDFIKCDVEGAELLVFKGGVETIKRDRPVIFTEILRKWSAKFNYRPDDIIELFRGLGYRCFTIKGDALSEFFVMDESTAETNFLFLHSDKHNDMIMRYARGSR